MTIQEDMPDSSIRPHHPSARSLSEMSVEFGIAVDADIDQIEVTGVASSASRVEAGDLFVALPGSRHHGAEFTERAVDQGAVAVLTDEAGAQLARGFGVPVLVVEEPRLAVGHVAAWVYRTDPEDPKLLGVTGTNGKTTVIYFLAWLLDQLGSVVGVSTTVERRIGDERIPARLTTPEADQMHALIARMREVGVRTAALEVSAHAISGHRIDGLLFDVVGFLNFSQDHLDDYGSMEEYFAAKLALFSPEHARRGVVSVDDEWGRRVVEGTRIPVTTIGGFDAGDADWHVRGHLDDEGQNHFSVVSPDGRRVSGPIDLPGEFSAHNAGIAIVMLHELGWEIEQIQEAIDRAGGFRAGVPGRLELVSRSSRGPRFYVDYGHTPEAFHATLAALRPLTPGRLIMVFGADGDRDRTKRAAMGRYAAAADTVIVTDYNPRFEDPAAIRSTLVNAVRAASPEVDLHEVADPAEALRLAVSLAGPGDTILNAGPGHETAMEVRGEHIPYSARDEARNALREAGW